MSSPAGKTRQVKIEPASKIELTMSHKSAHNPAFRASICEQTLLILLPAVTVATQGLWPGILRLDSGPSSTLAYPLFAVVTRTKTPASGSVSCY